MFTKENIITAIVSTVIVAVSIFCVNYLVMPVMNWGYFGYLWEVVILAILAVAINFFGLNSAYYNDEEDGFEKIFQTQPYAFELFARLANIPMTFGHFWSLKSVNNIKKSEDA